MVWPCCAVWVWRWTPRMHSRSAAFDSWTEGFRWSPRFRKDMRSVCAAPSYILGWWKRQPRPACACCGARRAPSEDVRVTAASVALQLELPVEVEPDPVIAINDDDFVLGRRSHVHT